MDGLQRTGGVPENPYGAVLGLTTGRDYGLDYRIETPQSGLLRLFS